LTGEQSGRVISAGTLNLQGNTGASFTNNDLSLGKLGYQQTWQHYIKVSAAGGINGIEIVLVDNPDYKDSGPVRSKLWSGLCNACWNLCHECHLRQ
jgi:hypothetical protein